MNEIILQKYKEYDYLAPKIKILVNYIKPSFLFKSCILTPIHLGRAVESLCSKDGVVTKEEILWLHNNCISDDFVGGISQYNRRIGFLTGTYWAWKNYNILGNPDYFGSFGYRRILNPVFLDNLLEYDLIVPCKKNFNFESIKTQFIKYHGQNLFDMALKFAPMDFEDYCNQSIGYFDEIYVMKKHLFFDFCEWIFPILINYLSLPQIVLKGNDYRDIGFIIERLTGYYLNKTTKNQDIKFKEVDILTTEKFKVNTLNLDKELLNKLRNKLKHSN